MRHGVVGSEEKKTTAIEAGADYVVDSSNQDFEYVANELTNGQGVDIVLDSVGGTVFEKSLTCLALYGRLVNFGESSGTGGHFTTKDLYSSCRSVLGFSLGTTRREKPQSLHQTAETILGFLQQGRLKAFIGRTFSLDAAVAHQWIESRQSSGKVLLRISDSKNERGLFW